MDPKMAAKKAELSSLLGEAKGRAAQGLKAKYAPPAPAPVAEEAVEVEVEAPAEDPTTPALEGASNDPELVAKLLELLESLKGDAPAVP